jgi:hypothetical protein
MMPRIGERGLVAISQNQISESAKAKANGQQDEVPDESRFKSDRLPRQTSRPAKDHRAPQTIQQTARKKVKVIMPNQSNAFAAPRRSVPTPGTASRTSGGSSRRAAELFSSTPQAENEQDGEEGKAGPGRLRVRKNATFRPQRPGGQG